MSYRLKNQTSQPQELPLPGRPSVPPRGEISIEDRLYHEGVKRLVDRGVFTVVPVNLPRQVAPLGVPAEVVKTARKRRT